MWIGGILIFSGRTNPTWSINKKTAEKLEQTWNSLRHLSEKPQTKPRLGYNGCFLKKDESHIWVVNEKIVTLQTKYGIESRWDKDGKFEELLLNSVPSGFFENLNQQAFNQE